MALAAEEASMGYDEKITNSNGAGFSNTEKYRAYGNSNGFVGGYASSSYFLSASPIAQDAEGNMERDYDYTVSRIFQELKDPAKVGALSAEKAISRLGAQKIPTSNMPVIFDAKCATGLVGHFLSAISGGSIYRKSSFLLDKLNTKVFPEFISVTEKPHILRGLGSSPFDTDGLETREQNFVENGALLKYILSVYSARRLNMTSTGNSGGVHNLMFSASKEHTVSRDELISKMDKGLIVTELMGQGINLVTGDYSRGASGFYVEGGQIKYPVSEITIAGNLANMFNQVLMVGSDVETRGNVLTGSILLEDMKIAGT
jgi:PmbA protein